MPQALLCLVPPTTSGTPAPIPSCSRTPSFKRLVRFYLRLHNMDASQACIERPLSNVPLLGVETPRRQSEYSWDRGVPQT